MTRVHGAERQVVRVIRRGPSKHVLFFFFFFSCGVAWHTRAGTRTPRRSRGVGKKIERDTSSESDVTSGTQAGQNLQSMLKRLSPLHFRNRNGGATVRHRQVQRRMDQRTQLSLGEAAPSRCRSIGGRRRKHERGTMRGGKIFALSTWHAAKSAITTDWSKSAEINIADGAHHTDKGQKLQRRAATYRRRMALYPAQWAQTGTARRWHLVSVSSSSASMSDGPQNACPRHTRTPESNHHNQRMSFVQKYVRQQRHCHQTKDKHMLR